jgi:hypothetical protein
LAPAWEQALARQAEQPAREAQAERPVREPEPALGPAWERGPTPAPAAWAQGPERAPD